MVNSFHKNIREIVNNDIKMWIITFRIQRFDLFERPLSTDARENKTDTAL